MSITSRVNPAILATVSKRVLLTTVIAAALSTATVAAQAETPASRRVSLEGLNLAKASDARIAYGRIRAAANAVCPGAGRDLRTARQHQQCYEAAMSDAVASVHSASLTNLMNSDRDIRIAQQGATHRGS